MNLQSDLNINTIKKGLYVVSTPIGNLGDITLRALKILSKSDYILCEDTRFSKKLLTKFKINSNLISYHKFNEKKNLQKIIEILKTEKIVSLISDAGTPAISDPGRILINECIKKNINVYPCPGPSAVSAAISISGFYDQYYFYGFFPEKKGEINKDLKILSELYCSIVFFVSAKKINRVIEPIKEYFSGRKIVICKEISKFYEEYYRNNVSELKFFEKTLKGEITLVISEKKHQKNISNNLTESDKKNIEKLIKKLTIKEITNLISEGKKISKKEIYNYCLKLKNEN
jgi:16S rRNA (cytidine1402-2'-O)-methyltransferase